MELCLRNNDPTQTLLMTPDGIVMYQVNSALGQTTTIYRFETHPRLLSTGRVSCVVGEVDSSRLRLLDSESPIEIVMVSGAEDTENVDRPWTFNGPDDKPYTWQIMFRSPVLFVSGNAPIPLARYRHAKLGIISRSRRAFLEIFPAGINVIDLIVVTFVSYAKHHWLDEPHHESTASAV
ncbi:hypothetical protein DEU56DRAFT_537141 [Suillus clintonianus]|uniref:uncharacterized protein n=1 Tax=Suillus clintonianus TaxID=1904413 RepID=UPI001B8758F4|nr:uncharacterized protein DEU56DRAFT_537141 [Suillus clintonianus]KAG2126832.1 hypothetical protein DEU56DRAFT_537141 [Suillus clintonianus]